MSLFIGKVGPINTLRKKLHKDEGRDGVVLLKATPRPSKRNQYTRFPAAGV